MVTRLQDVLDDDTRSLSKGHRKLARYIQGHADEVAFLTSGRLAEKTELSEATVIRFVRNLGYRGYSDFKEALQSDIKERITPSIKIRDTVERIHDSTEVFSNWLQIDRAMIQELEKSCSEDDIQHAISLIQEDSTVYLVGLGVSRAIVDFLEFRMSRLRQKVVAITSGGESILDKLMTLTASDVMIGIGFFRPHRELIVAFDVAAAKGVPRIAFTDSDSSPVALNADVVLRANRGPADIMTSLAAPMTVANILIVALARRNEERAINAFAELDNLCEKYRL